MALFHSTAQKNQTLDGTGPVKTNYNSGNVKFYSGSVPASADAAEGTLTTTVALPATLFPAPSGGVLTSNAITSATISNTQTVTCFRQVQSGDTGGVVTTTQPRIQGAVATSGAECTVNTTAFVSGGTISFGSPPETYTHPQ